jgi:RNA polymerase sigma factor (sigma-70 family)
LVRPIARAVLSHLPSSFEIADLVQTGMIGLIQAAAAFDVSRGVPFAIFARQRIRGAILDSVRRQAWHEETHQPLMDTPGPEPDVVATMRASQVWEAVVALPPRDGQLVVMHFYEGRSLAESGERLGLSKTRALQLVRRALEQIRQQLAS